MPRAQARAPPVVCENLRTEKRFTVPTLLLIPHAPCGHVMESARVARHSASGSLFSKPAMGALGLGFHFGVAARASDADLALTLGDGEDLTAGGTFEEVRGLALFPHLLGGALGTVEVGSGGFCGIACGCPGTRTTCPDALHVIAEDRHTRGEGEKTVVFLAAGRLVL